MSRYLSPARLYLLALIELYITGESSTDDGLQILDYITGQLNVFSEISSSGVHNSRRHFSHAIASFGSQFQRWRSRIPGRNMYDALLERVWEFDGFDSFHSLFSKMQSVVQPSNLDIETSLVKISRSSPIGQFIRRCYIEFTRLNFADSRTLWLDFEAYREPSFDEWSTKHPEISAQYRNEQATKKITAWTKPLSADKAANGSGHSCTSDSEAIIQFALHRVQKLGSRVPEDVRTQMKRRMSEEWESNHHSLRFFVAFFEHWRAGQYTTALESLHQYFDYSLAARNAGSNMRLYYQYALLYLSVLHADFECWDESVDTMNECLATGMSLPVQYPPSPLNKPLRPEKEHPLISFFIGLSNLLH